jgi:hypothetical protein
MKKMLLLLILSTSCASLMAMESQEHIIPTDDASKEKLASMLHARKERMLNDEEHRQLHAGKPQKSPVTTSSESTHN